MSDGVTPVLEGLAHELENPPLKKIGVMASEMIRNHIYRGEGFEPLSPATQAYRGRGRPLQDTGGRRDSVTMVESITPTVLDGNTVSVGTTAEYAPIHNSGGVITAKKNWLWIPAAGTRQLERKYGRKPGDVLKGLRGNDCWVYRVGRTVCYRKKRKGSKARVVYYLKKSVRIPKREFFYITKDEAETLLEEIINDIV